ncbi:MAG: stage III sporulation protein AG [Oscillospiraceae bacterium]|jgi:stage III sporulation protein AG|nr:stage III sporulation protein AG [Pseudoflavonifractor sp.]MDY3018880.1 stage III sporulation protein AG [Oscillospiraceae bacterium]
MSGKEWGEKLRLALGKCKYVLLVGLVGAVLLLLPTGEKTGQTAPAAASETDLFQVESMERRLETALSRVEGAGEVTVVLTLKDGPRQVLAQDGSASEGDSQTTRETSTVMASKGSGTQEPVALQELGPCYRGALVVAPGAGDPQVRLALSEAVSALTGLGADKISICKGK